MKRALGALTRRWREWRDARQEYSDSLEEMQFHIEQETRHNMRNGMSLEAARRAAAKAFGGVDRFAEVAAAERPRAKWSDFRMSYLDWKLGGRMLLKYPGVSIISVITLAAAMGLGAGWFELTMSVFYPELPVADGERVVRIEYWDPMTQDPELRTMHEFVQWREQLSTIEQLGAHRTVERNLLLPGNAPQVIEVAEMSAAGFTVMRAAPLLGRPLLAADEQPGARDVVVIGYNAWQRYFGGDPGVIDTEVKIGRTTATVVGVMPEGFAFPRRHQFWLPLRPTLAEPLTGAPIEVFGRLRAGASMDAAAAELAAWAARMKQASPETHERLDLHALPFAASREVGEGREIFLINVAAWLILALACANVAALMFARTALREGEIVVRNALGASRGRVMGQLFTEALVLTTVAAILGLIVLKILLGYMSWDGRAPFWWETDLEFATILYTAALALVGAAMVGLLPALRATGRQVRARMSHINSGGTSIRFGGAWSVIIVLQVTLSVLALPFGIAVMLEMWQESRVRAAFPAEAYLTFIPVGVEELEVQPGRDVIGELVTRLRQEPEVMAVTTTRALPGLYHPLQQLEVQRGSEAPRLVDANTEGDRVRVGAVAPGFFSAFDRPVIAGREFVPGDIDAADRVVVINEALARNIGGNPVGASVRYVSQSQEQPGPWMEVVGVAGNFGLTPTAHGEADYLFEPVTRENPGYVVVRTNGDPADFAPRLRTLAMQVDALLRVHDVLPLREAIRREDRGAILIALIGIGVILLAISLSAASLYALMSVSVALRTREIGVRVAIGASAREVLTSLFSRAAAQVGIGIVIGNLLVLIALSALIQEVELRFVLPPMGAASLVMLLVGVGAAFLPARRALRVHPTEALREAR